MNNFLEETIEFLKLHGKQESDVLWVGNETYTISWDKFKKAASFDYDEDFGVHEIDLQLIVVGKDWWLERIEYDGSEEWVFKSYPQQPDEKGLASNIIRVNARYDNQDSAICCAKKRRNDWYLENEQIT